MHGYVSFSNSAVCLCSPIVQTVSKDASIMRDTKDKQISELKKMIEDSNETQRNEYEKRVCQHLSHACFCFCFLLFIPQLV